LKMWCCVNARGTVERLLSKSTDVPAIADCGWGKNAYTSSKHRKPTERDHISEREEHGQRAPLGSLQMS
jgi:hypothetical protein